MDAIDIQTISELKKNSRASWGFIADKVGISRQALKTRVSRLEDTGVIAGYTILTVQKTPNETNKVQAILRISFSNENDCFKLSRHFSSYSEVQAAWALAGEWDCIVILAASDTKRISEIREIIVGMGGIKDIRIEIFLEPLFSREPNNSAKLMEI